MRRRATPPTRSRSGVRALHGISFHFYRTGSAPIQAPSVRRMWGVRASKAQSQPCAAVMGGGQMMTDPRFADGTAFIDGGYVPIQEARIPILDHGFLRSDATYDVVHVWKGYLF